MSFISPALISRIYQALGRNRGGHAILLLRQHSFAERPRHDNELMSMVARLADQCLVNDDWGRAEEHYKLGLALYESCFQDHPVEALRCASGLMAIYERQKRYGELRAAIDTVSEISKALGTLSKSCAPVRAV